MLCFLFHDVKISSGRLCVQVTASHFEGLLTTFIGYLVIAVCFMTVYLLCSLARLKKWVDWVFPSWPVARNAPPLLTLFLLLPLTSLFDSTMAASVGKLAFTITEVFRCVLFYGFRFRRVIGLCYVVVKVKLLVVMEIGVFPLICGWWLDICSLVSWRHCEISFISVLKVTVLTSYSSGSYEWVSYSEGQTPSTGLQHPPSNHCHNCLHRVSKTFS